MSAIAFAAKASDTLCYGIVDILRASGADSLLYRWPKVLLYQLRCRLDHGNSRIGQSLRCPCVLFGQQYQTQVNIDCSSILECPSWSCLTRIWAARSMPGSYRQSQKDSGCSCRCGDRSNAFQENGFETKIREPSLVFDSKEKFLLQWHSLAQRVAK